MKLQLHSDLHLEFYSPEDQAWLLAKLKPEADVFVLAGDIVGLKNGPGMLARVFADVSKRWKHVIYVPGNHEFYGTSMAAGWDAIRAAGAPFDNVHALNNRGVIIDGVRFYGGTGWFPETYNHPLAPYWHEGLDLRKHMADFRLIKEFEPAVYADHRLFANNLSLAIDEAAPDVVVSHHLPTEECVSPRFRGNPLNVYFVSCFDVAAVGAQLWFHGHTHDLVDTKVGGTRIVANPYGYPREFYPDREPRSVVLEALPKAPATG